MQNRIYEIFGEQPLVPSVVEDPVGKMNYMIVITPRSGSSWLASLLKNANLGYPREWFNPNAMRRYLAEHGKMSLLEYIARIKKQHRTAEGIFGAKASLHQLKDLIEVATIEQVLGGSGQVWFKNTRQNMVLQAISSYLARESNLYHSFSEDEQKRAAYEKVPYDGEQIGNIIRTLLRQEKQIEKIFEKNHIEPVRLTYEQNVSDPEGLLRLFAEKLGIAASGELKAESEIKKISNERNLEWEKRFRQEHPDIVEEYESAHQAFGRS